MRFINPRKNLKKFYILEKLTILAGKLYLRRIIRTAKKIIFHDGNAFSRQNDFMKNQG